MRFAFLYPLLVIACGPAEAVSLDAAVDDAALDDAGLDGADSATAKADAKADADAGAAEAEAGPACIKQLTVLFSVGTGAGALRDHQSGCWTVLDADGSANKQFRKCSTSSWTVQNPTAPNYAFDDTNPNTSLTQDQDFLKQCAANATGDGFEYMAYRGSWRLLGANHLRAFFAELYAGDGDVDDYYPNAYVNNGQLANHTVYPMINIGPTNVANPASEIKSDGLKICNAIEDGGYFGVYVGTWNQPMDKTDPRIVALADALDACTKK